MTKTPVAVKKLSEHELEVINPLLAERNKALEIFKKAEEQFIRSDTQFAKTMRLILPNWLDKPGQYSFNPQDSTIYENVEVDKNGVNSGCETKLKVEK